MVQSQPLCVVFCLRLVKCKSRESCCWGRAFEQVHTAGNEISQNRPGWNILLRSSSLPSCSRGSAAADCPEPCPVASWVCPQMRSPQPAGQPLWPPSYLVFKQNFTFQFLSTASCAVSEHPWEELSSLFFMSLVGYLYLLLRSLKIWQSLFVESLWGKNSLKEDKMVKLSGS